MKISALIEQLSKLKEEHGDLPVTVNVIYGWEEVDEGNLTHFMIMKPDALITFNRIFLKGEKIL
jgi:hypothetical protein